MLITIRPDPDTIELIINHGEVEGIQEFLKSVGVPEKEASNWKSPHTIEINEKASPWVKIFEMSCYLPEVLFEKSDWIFKISQYSFFTSFIVNDQVVCCKLLNTLGLKELPENLLNLNCGNFGAETLSDDFQELKNLHTLKSISFSSCSFLENISIIENLINLNLIDLKFCESLTDISPLSSLTQLQSLKLNCCESLTDISPLSSLNQLQSLDLGWCKSLADISPLSSLTQLQSLNLGGYQSLTNISPLSSLTQLQSLNLGSCESLADISPLSSLTQLQSLDLGGCQYLADISPLSSLTQLQSLNLGSCESLADISPLSSLTQLQSLNLGSCKSLTDISPLYSLTQLQSLDLSWCKSLADISPFSSLNRLQSLNLGSCESLADISPLSSLTQLQSLNLGSCKSLTDIRPLSSLTQLQSLDLSWCKSLADISPFSSLNRLQSLNLGSCESLADISPFSSLNRLQSLDLGSCESLADISPLSSLTQLQSLDLSWCKSLTDIRPLSSLTQLRNLNLGFCESLTDISPLSSLTQLQSLDLSRYQSLTDIRPLSSLTQLQSLNLGSCESLADISPLSPLTKLRSLDLSDCEALAAISGLASLLNLQTLNINKCKRIQNYSFLRNCRSLIELKESKMHPSESAELLCYLAVQRNDISFIANNSNKWLKELELCLKENLPISNDLACSLAKGIILANLEEPALSFHKTLLKYNNAGVAPWKIWFSQILNKYGWDTFQKLSELNQPSELTFGAIAGISSCLPSLDDDPIQVAWAKKWISEINSLHKNNPGFLKPSAAEWCLALKRLGEDQLLTEWIEKFTDPSDPSSLDPINQVFSAYTLGLNDRESALEYAIKINNPKLRDESILNLANQFLMEKEITKAGDFLFLLTEVEFRTKLATNLADDADYLKNDENAHRLLAACGNNPISLINIFDQIRIANPNSEILKIMDENLDNEEPKTTVASLLIIDLNKKSFHITEIIDSSKFTKLKQAVDSILNSN